MQMPFQTNIPYESMGSEDDVNKSERSLKHQVDLKEVEKDFNTLLEHNKKYNKLFKDIESSDNKAFVRGNFYSQFITATHYLDDKEKQIIFSHDQEVAKALAGLEKTNATLKMEMRSWADQFGKAAHLNEKLIVQNKLLRKSICDQNREIIKLIEKVGKGDNQLVRELNQELGELQEENNVLFAHYEQIRAQIQQKKQEENNLLTAIKKATLEYDNVKKECQLAEEDQEHYSKMYTLLESSIQDLTKRKKKLEKEKEKLERQKKQYKIDHEKLEQDFNKCQTKQEQIENTLLKPFQNAQTEKLKLIVQIQQKSQKIQRQKEQIRYYQNQILQHQQKSKQYIQKNKQYESKFAQLQKQLISLKEQIKNSQDFQTKQLVEIQIKNYEIKSLQKQIQQLLQQKKNLNEEQNVLLKKKEKQYQKQIQKWKGHQQSLHQKCTAKLIQKRNQLSIKQEQLQTWEQKNFDMKQEVNQLKEQMQEIKINQSRAAALRDQLKTAGL